MRRIRYGRSHVAASVCSIAIFPWFVSAGFGQVSHWRDGAAPIPAQSNLRLRWDASEVIPSNVWIYRLLPNRFSQDIVSNVANLCGFTSADKRSETLNSVTFESTDGAKSLVISFLAGRMTYETRNPHYGPTNLTQGVPLMTEIPRLATEFVKRLGISLSDITDPYDSEPKIEGATRFHLSEPGITYFVKGASIHNTEFRTAKFWRCVDGMAIIGGDGGEVSFGEYGKIRSFALTWRVLKRYQYLPTVTSEMAAKLVRGGEAVEELIPGQIDWAKVQSLIVKKASPLYYDGHSEWLWPFLGLVAEAEPSFGLTQFGIDCPLIDEGDVRKLK